jgi:hypothetical protein
MKVKMEHQHSVGHMYYYSCAILKLLGCHYLEDGIRDIAKDSRTNLEIQAFNAKLSKITKSFRHVTLVEIDINRKYFTKHGLLLNNAGKEWLAKLIASQIDKLTNDIKKLNP